MVTRSELWIVDVRLAYQDAGSAEPGLVPRDTKSRLMHPNRSDGHILKLCTPF